MDSNKFKQQYKAQDPSLYASKTALKDIYIPKKSKEVQSTPTSTVKQDGKKEKK